MADEWGWARILCADYHWQPYVPGGRTNKELRIYCLDLGGKKIWESPNGRGWDGPNPGARASCAYSEGRIYQMNAHGRIGCFDAANGSEVWEAYVLDRFDGKVPTWAICENLLVDGKVVVVTPGGTRALMAGLDKTTGATIWSTEPLRLGFPNFVIFASFVVSHRPLICTVPVLPRRFFQPSACRSPPTARRRAPAPAGSTPV